MTFVDRCRRTRHAHRRVRREKELEARRLKEERLEADRLSKKAAPMPIDTLTAMGSIGSLSAADLTIELMDVDPQLLSQPKATQNTTDEQPQFKFFLRLPTELRFIIYELILPEPRHLDLSKDLQNNLHFCDLKWLDSFNIAPVTNYINHESRKFAAKFYDCHQLFKMPRQYEHVWFSPTRDTIQLNMIDLLKTSPRKKNIRKSILKWNHRFHNFEFLYSLFSRVTKVECAFTGWDLGRSFGEWRTVRDEAKKGLTRTWIRNRALPYFENLETITVALIKHPQETAVFQGFKDELEDYAEFMKWTCVEINKVNTKFCLPRIVLAYKNVDKDASFNLKEYMELEYDLVEKKDKKDEKVGDKDSRPIPFRLLKGIYGSLA